jgi:hypothetical protein
VSGRTATLASALATPARVGAFAGLSLLAVYTATLAPDVTFWDAGEFIAAAETLGIPHPPGTPLYVLLLAAWSRLLPWVPTAVATNLFSAVCTAAACGLGAFLVGSRTGNRPGAFAAGLCAGGMSTVWLNATETEVYATTLALAVATLLAADRGGRVRDRRWLMLTVYLIALAVPLHMSALVAGPAIVYAAAADETGVIRWPHALIVGGAWLIAMGVGTISRAAMVVGILIAVAGAGLGARPWGDRGTLSVRVRSALRTTAFVLVVVATASSALAFLVIRAQHDPHINQGAPATLDAFADVVARRQYDVAPIWPRRAPLWLQTANVFQYADWQVALSLGTTVIPTPLRLAATIGFAILGLVGCLAHRRRDSRSWRLLMLLLVCGSLGVVGYLNLRAGPSFGWGILPDNATREARERDYFFVLGFWAWGMWAGYGAIVAASRFRLPAGVGVAVAALPVALNWTAIDRRRWPDAALPRFLAVSLLGATPQGSVLFVGGDNDTYPLWYAQAVLGIRRDVTVITTPLLPADWYRRELARRHALHPDPAASVWEGRTAASQEIARRAQALGRPVAVAITMPGDERRSIASAWELRGPVFVRADGATARLLVDSVRTARWAANYEAWRRGRVAGPSIDQTGQLVLDVLSCPGFVVGRNVAGASVRTASRSLASLCNLR